MCFMESTVETITMELKALEQGGFAFWVDGLLISAGAAGTVAAGASRYLRKLMKEAVAEDED